MDKLTSLEINKAILHSEIETLERQARILLSQIKCLGVEKESLINVIKEKTNQAQELAEQIDKINYEADIIRNHYINANSGSVNGVT